MSEAAAGAIADGVHVLPLRVYYEDTDASGVVYYANYLRFIERGRTEMLRLLGVSHRALDAGAGIAFAVRRCEIDYLAPARLDDEIEVHTAIAAVGGATIEARQSVRRGKDELARGTLRLACVGADGRPRRVPGAVRAALTSLAVNPPRPLTDPQEKSA